MCFNSRASTSDSLIQRSLRWSYTNFEIKIFFPRWSDTNFDQNFVLHDEAIHPFKIRAIKRHFYLSPSMKRHRERETVVLRTAYWHGILPSLLGPEVSEVPGWLPLADLASACLEQLIRIPPPNHVYHLLLCFNSRAGTSVSLVSGLRQ